MLPDPDSSCRVSWRDGRVTRLSGGWAGCRELEVQDTDGRLWPALAYPALVGEPAPGDRVLLNVTAVELGLGTGGYALVVAIPDRLPPDRPGPGHLVKARYTPLQTVVAGADEQDAPSHQLLRDDEPLRPPGMVVVAADLHSALPAVLVGVQTARPGTRVAYLMGDGGALPLWFSRTVALLRPRLVGTVTVGQAFGGDLEAVTVHSGLLAAARVLGAEVTVVSQGPGNLGTGTAWGFSGVAAGEAVNAAVAVGARPVGALRMSGVDPRPRHRGLSHHSVTAYGRVALAGCDLALPRSAVDLVRPDQLALLRQRHQLVEVDDAGLVDALAASNLPLESMGRGLAADPLAFVAAAAAGRHAAALLT